MAILSNIFRCKKYIKEANGFRPVSEWQLAKDVECADGQNVETKLTNLNNSLTVVSTDLATTNSKFRPQQFTPTIRNQFDVHGSFYTTEYECTFILNYTAGLNPMPLNTVMIENMPIPKIKAGSQLTLSALMFDNNIGFSAIPIALTSNGEIRNGINIPYKYTVFVSASYLIK